MMSRMAFSRSNNRCWRNPFQRLCRYGRHYYRDLVLAEVTCHPSPEPINALSLGPHTK